MLVSSGFGCFARFWVWVCGGVFWLVVLVAFLGLAEFISFLWGWCNTGSCCLDDFSGQGLG